MDIGGWLRQLALERYEPAFLENRIDADILPKLTAEDLKDLGVSLVGDRRRLLEAIAALQEQSPAPSKPASESADQALPPERSPEFDRPGSAGERRHLTVMFCDLVGSTQIAATLDAEEWRDILANYHRIVTDSVTRFGGHVAKNLGDGALIYFGYPQARENDAERAVRAAIAIVDAVAEQSSRVAAAGGPTLAVRVGIHEGSVVLSESGELYGELPNVAARLQSMAEPATVLITRDVHRMISGLFVVSDRGFHNLKGVTEPVGLFQVLRASGVGRRRAAARTLTPLVGRDEELRQIENRWRRTQAGQGQLVMLLGDAGLGKSRLIEEFQRRLADTPHTWAEFACSQLLQNTPFQPFVEFAKRKLEEQEPAPERRLAALAEWHRSVGLDPAQSVPLVAPVLELPLTPDYPEVTAASDERRRKLIATLAAWIMGGARTQPVVLHMEDVHWADPSTLDLLQLLAEQCARAPLLLLITTRPEFRAAWSHRSHHTVVALAPLEAREVQQMVHRVAAQHALSPQTIDALVTRTGGVPLFIEEVTRLLVEGNDQTAMRSIPSTLQGLLTARLDRLGAAKEVAQIASVVGRDFSYQLIRAVAGQSEATLMSSLDQLAEADLVYVQGISPASSYRFKHALMQDAAYETMLKSRRRELHRLVAQCLREQFKDIAETEPELLANHLTQAGAADEAIAYWQRAGQQAVARSANIEAISHFTNGLQLVQLLPEGAGRDQLELDLRVAIGVPLIATRGYASAEVEATYARARALSEKAGESPQFANILWGLWVRYLTGGPIGAALEMGEQYQAIAERTQNSGHLLETCQVVGIPLFYLGEPQRALSYFTRGSAMYRLEEHHALIYEHGGADTGVAIRTHEALALWTLGYPDQARERMQLALETAKALERHTFTLAFAHYFDAWLHKLCHEEQLVKERTDSAIRICEEQRFPFWGLASTVLRGSALVEQGSVEEGVVAMRDALASYEGIGGQLYAPELHGLLAAGLGASGRIDEALEAAAEALRIVKTSQDHWWLPELHRLRGELVLKLDAKGISEAEASLQEALSVARAQQAKSWELRAATSLARLWHRNGETPKARQLLEDTYGWFKEGFGTADLRASAMLLSDLNQENAG